MIDIIFDPFNYPFWILLLIILIATMVVISRPFSTYIKFAYPNAWFEAIGNPYIKENELNRLLDSKNLIEFKDTLNTFKDYNIKGENSQEIHQSLDEAFVRSIKISAPRCLIMWQMNASRSWVVMVIYRTIQLKVLIGIQESIVFGKGPMRSIDFSSWTCL